MDYGTYDGELLIPGKQSHNVVELEKAGDLAFVAFDILEDDCDINLLGYELDERKIILQDQIDDTEPTIQIAKFQIVETQEMVDEAFEKIIEQGGEGLILKNPEGIYHAGKRPARQWIKLKAVRTAVMLILGFAPGKNGPFSRAVLEGDDLVRATVKVRNDALTAEVHQNPQKFIGRRLRISYTERYEGGKYRHPRWDHLLDEDDNE
jgi:ATP-dependent DNA ligase